MKILVTGSNGFIANNLIESLKKDKDKQLYLYSKGDSIDILKSYLAKVDFIYHLAGVNRPKNVSEFYEGNRDLTEVIVNFLIKNRKSTPIVFSSSTQATKENDYGKSKLDAEKLLLNYQKISSAKVYIYRLPNVFGKWCKPNYNSVIATWCYNIANNLDIVVNNRDTKLNLVYIDDVVESFVDKIKNTSDEKYIEIDKIYKKSLGEIEGLLYKFKNNANDIIKAKKQDFEGALYATYMSYLHDVGMKK